MFSLFDLTKNNLMANEIRIYLSVGYVGKPFTTSSVLWKRTLCVCVCVRACHVFMCLFNGFVCSVSILVFYSKCMRDICFTTMLVYLLHRAHYITGQGSKSYLDQPKQSGSTKQHPDQNKIN